MVEERDKTDGVIVVQSGRRRERVDETLNAAERHHEVVKAGGEDKLVVQAAND